MTSKEWKEYKIGTICEVLSSKRIFAADYVETGIPFYRSKEIIQKSLGENIEEKLYISKEKFLDIKTKFGAPQKLDLLLSAVGERSGIPYLVNDDEEFYFKDGNLIWFRNFNSNLINSNYLYYWLKSYTGQNSLQNLMIGSAQKALTIIGIKGLSIKLPPLKTQEKIARVLSSLDDKIELNNKINQNLEQQAQAIFKSWFVDFEPFGGKMPADWRIGKLGELVEITSGKRPQLKQADKDNKFDIPIIGASNIMGYTNAVLYNEPILITGRVGTHGIINKYNKQCWPSDNTLVIKSEYYEYIYQQLKRVNFAGLNRGSTQPLITQKDLFNVSIVIPTSQKIKEYEKFATQLNKSQDNLIAENKKLCSIRDILLPKLLNNELNIDNIEV